MSNPHGKSTKVWRERRRCEGGFRSGDCERNAAPTWCKACKEYAGRSKAASKKRSEKRKRKRT